MRRSLGDRVRRFLNRLGVDLYRYPMLQDPQHVRATIFGHLGVNVVLDVGANIGQYGDRLRSAAYRGRIVSFEPVSSEFAKLRARAASDSKWQCHQLALGDRAGSAEIRVSGEMSSLLERDSGGTTALPFDVTAREPVQVARLDDIRRAHFQPNDNVLLKLDVQGYEMSVLRGAPAALSEVRAVEMELSLVPVYAGQTGYREMIEYMRTADYDLWSVHPASREDSGRLVEMDGIFVRRA